MENKQPSLFAEQTATSWKAPEVLPVLDSRFKKVWLDFETDGTDLYGRSMPVGLAIATDNQAFYFPFKHLHGGNLDEGLVKRWAQRELRDKIICMAEAKFDIGMARKWGVDLEAQGCQPQELQFKAGLLDDERRSFKLDDMGADIIGVRKLPIDGEKIWEYPASYVGPYAERDVTITRDVDKALDNKIREESLERVLDLENSIIYAVCEMERTGARIDEELLHRWRRETQKIYESCIFEINKSTGLKVNPDSAKDLEVLFRILKIDFGTTEQGRGSFTDKFLKDIEHPTIQAIRRARTVSSLKSKYLDKYAEAIVDGILRYKLHQLKGNEYGTISGRFSSSNINIQQVFAPGKQIKKFGSSEFLVRQLFIPDPGMFWVKADASQIEFRLFVHYSNSPRLLQAYRENPDVDFHNIVMGLLHKKKQVSRDDTKNINFGKLYGMGRGKMAREMDLPQAESDELFEAYDQEFPEAGVLMDQAMHNARERKFVFTIMGRRARFPKAERLHSALNRVIQGSAADVMKIKIRDVYRERKNLGIHKMRFTVHDELDVDMENPDDAKKLKALLDEQALPVLRVPLTWDVKVGKNWAMR